MGIKQEVRKANTKQQPQKTQCDPISNRPKRTWREQGTQLSSRHLGSYSRRTASDLQQIQGQPMLHRSPWLIRTIWYRSPGRLQQKNGAQSLPEWQNKFNASVPNCFTKSSSRPEKDTKDRFSNRKILFCTNSEHHSITNTHMLFVLLSILSNVDISLKYTGECL